MTISRTARIRLAVFSCLCVLLSAACAAQTHVITQELMDASSWFGGDNRPTRPRTVGVGQLVLMDTSMTINSFSFHFASIFDLAQNPAGAGHDVTLRLHIRDRAGVILKTTDVAVPASFTSVWVTWDALDTPVPQGVKCFFTAYVVGGFDTSPYYSSFSATTTNPYAEGTLMAKDSQSDTALDNWDEWTPNAGWDAAFRLTGTITTTGLEEGGRGSEPGILLSQTYPNPASTSATFEYRIPRRMPVLLELYNAAGLKIRTIIDGEFNAGAHQVQWSNDGLPAGMYTLQLRAGETVRTQQMLLLRR